VCSSDLVPVPPSSSVDDAALAALVTRGGYPELATGGARRTRDWFESYLTTILQRDVRELARIEGLAELPRLIGLAAARTMGLLSHAGLARDAGLPQTTSKRYFALLEAAFLIVTLPAWHANVGKRLAKAPKVMLADTGLAAHLRGADADRLLARRDEFGPLLENFVAMELVKQAAWSRTRPRLHHFRSHQDDEVDLVLEAPGGDVVGVEVKAAATVGPGDLRGLRALAALAGPRFRRGILLHTGHDVVPFAANLHAVPMASLWEPAGTVRT